MAYLGMKDSIAYIQSRIHTLVRVTDRFIKHWDNLTKDILRPEKPIEDIVFRRKPGEYWVEVIYPGKRDSGGLFMVYCTKGLVIVLSDDWHAYGNTENIPEGSFVNFAGIAPSVQRQMVTDLPEFLKNIMDVLEARQILTSNVSETLIKMINAVTS